MSDHHTESISLTLPAALLRETDRCAETLSLTRAAYVRRALEKSNADVNRDARRLRMYKASLRVRDESSRAEQELES